MVKRIEKCSSEDFESNNSDSCQNSIIRRNITPRSNKASFSIESVKKDSYFIETITVLAPIVASLLVPIVSKYFDYKMAKVGQSSASGLSMANTTPFNNVASNITSTPQSTSSDVMVIAKDGQLKANSILYFVYLWNSNTILDLTKQKIFTFIKKESEAERLGAYKFEKMRSSDLYLLMFENILQKDFDIFNYDEHPFSYLDEKYKGYCQNVSIQVGNNVFQFMSYNLFDISSILFNRLKFYNPHTSSWYQFFSYSDINLALNQLK